MKTKKKAPPVTRRKPGPKPKAKPVPIPTKRPRGRPPKARPDEVPAPTPQPQPQPPAGDDSKIIEALLVRLVSPLRSLPVQTAEAVVYVRPEDIAFITTTADRRILINDRNGEQWQRFDFLNALEKKLAGDPRFFRPHKSFLINVFAVKTLRRNPKTNLYEVTFGDKVKGVASVSAGNLKQLRALLEL